ncbi:hypothetical protein [Rhodococcoides fascians]|uniref:hypothetical protein n=1 Tax=Rhodococcoides fascians TaxID=1828 RepID=UPI00050C9EFE|nr:hypothetical protein [Rhodococcus fascians]
MSFIRTKESASPFKASQTVAQVATIIGTTSAAVIAIMATRSRPGATASTSVDFTTAETILRVFQEEAVT